MVSSGVHAGSATRRRIAVDPGVADRHDRSPEPVVVLGVPARDPGVRADDVAHGEHAGGVHGVHPTRRGDVLERLVVLVDRLRVPEPRDRGLLRGPDAARRRAVGLRLVELLRPSGARQRWGRGRPELRRTREREGPHRGDPGRLRRLQRRRRRERPGTRGQRRRDVGDRLVAIARAEREEVARRCITDRHPGVDPGPTVGPECRDVAGVLGVETRRPGGLRGVGSRERGMRGRGDRGVDRGTCDLRSGRRRERVIRGVTPGDLGHGVVHRQLRRRHGDEALDREHVRAPGRLDRDGVPAPDGAREGGYAGHDARRARRWRGRRLRRRRRRAQPGRRHDGDERRPCSGRDTSEEHLCPPSIVRPVDPAVATLDLTCARRPRCERVERHGAGTPRERGEFRMDVDARRWEGWRASPGAAPGP